MNISVEIDLADKFPGYPSTGKRLRVHVLEKFLHFTWILQAEYCVRWPLHPKNVLHFSSQFLKMEQTLGSLYWNTTVFTSEPWILKQFGTLVWAL